MRTKKDINFNSVKDEIATVSTHKEPDVQGDGC